MSVEFQSDLLLEHNVIEVFFHWISLFTDTSMVGNSQCICIYLFVYFRQSNCCSIAEFINAILPFLPANPKSKLKLSALKVIVFLHRGVIWQSAPLTHVSTNNGAITEHNTFLNRLLLFPQLAYTLLQILEEITVVFLIQFKKLRSFQWVCVKINPLKLCGTRRNVRSRSYISVGGPATLDTQPNSLRLLNLLYKSKSNNEQKICTSCF